MSVSAVAIIRSAVVDDYPSILKIERAAHYLPWTEKTLMDSLTRYNTWVICLEKEVVGLLTCLIAADTATILNIAIHPTHQHRGFGRQLLQHLIAHAAQNNLHELFLEVRTRNQAAIALYHSVGFNAMTIRRGYYDNPDGSKEDAILMGLHIPT